MPACVDCIKFDPSGPRCTVEDVSPIRQCVIASLEQHLSALEGRLVCEIGCGAWPFAKNIVEGKGCEWLGIDPKEYNGMGRKTIRTHEGTVASVPLPDDHVDVVLANQSLEHWHEYGTSFRRGFREIHRILKPGGVLIMNFPIHLHGHPIFIRGEISNIRALWSPKLWNNLVFEEWRRNYHPLERYQGWKLIRNDEHVIRNLGQVSTWTMNVIARKRRESNSPIPGRQELVVFRIDLKTAVGRRRYRLVRGIRRRSEHLLLAGPSWTLLKSIKRRLSRFGQKPKGYHD